MDEFSPNTNEQQIQENIREQLSDEESTIFSAPTSHDDRREVKKGARLKKILSLALVLVLLAITTTAVITLIPVPEDDVSINNPTITVVDLNSDDIERIVINNNGTKLTLLSSLVEAEGQSSIVWTLEGYDAELIDATTVASAADDMVAINAFRTMDGSADYGFDTVTVSAEVIAKDTAQNFTVMFGDISPDGSGVYMKLSTADTVYLVSSTEYSVYQNDALYYAINTALGGIDETDDNADYYNNGSLSSFDSLTLSGENYPQTFKVEPNDDTPFEEYVAFKAVSPTERLVDNMTELITSLGNGITTAGAYSFDKSEAALKKFGLDKPYLTATITVGNQTRTYKFAKVDDTYAAVICDNDKLIRKVELSSLTFIDSKATDFYYKAVFLESIYDINEFTVSSASGNYTFDVSYTPADEEAGTDEILKISYNGNELVTKNFQNYYRTLVSLVPVDYTVKEIAGNYEATLTLTHTNGYRDTVIGFKKYSNQRYQYYINGIAQGQITSSDYEKILTYTKMVANGEELNVHL